MSTLDGYVWLSVVALLFSFVFLQIYKGDIHEHVCIFGQMCPPQDI